MGRFRVEVDKNTCQGFGACIELCSRFFQLSDVDGKSSIVGAERIMKEDKGVLETLDLDKLECINEAAEACPFNAIHIVNIETSEKLI